MILSCTHQHTGAQQHGAPHRRIGAAAPGHGACWELLSTAQRDVARERRQGGLPHRSIRLVRSRSTWCCRCLRSSRWCSRRRWHPRWGSAEVMPSDGNGVRGDFVVHAPAHRCAAAWRSASPNRSRGPRAWRVLGALEHCTAGCGERKKTGGPTTQEYTPGAVSQHLVLSVFAEQSVVQSPQVASALGFCRSGAEGGERSEG